MSRRQTQQGLHLAGCANMGWDEYAARNVTIVRQMGTPKLGTAFCSCCTAPHGGNSVRMGTADGSHFVLLCLDCARRVGEAAR